MNDLDEFMTDMDVWVAFYDHLISLAQLRAQLRDRGWRLEAIEDRLDGGNGDEE